MEKLCSRNFISFHGYKIFRNGVVLNKNGTIKATEIRERRGGGYDVCVRLHYNKTQKKWTLQRLVAACFLGPIDGYEINHKDRNPQNNHVDNLERMTPSQNQKHWRENEKRINNTTRSSDSSNAIF